MRISPLWSLAAVASLVAAAACGGGQAEPVTPTTPSASASDSAAAPTASATASAAPSASATAEAGPVWKDDMTKDAKVAYMKANVAPRMGKVFKEHDAKKYGEFSCKTCHGPNNKAPKEFLPKLTMKGGNLTAFAEKPEMSKWMHEVVVPEMAAAMGQKPYDPATKTGFGCMGCHSVEMK